jgi:hypothetical protein
LLRYLRCQERRVALLAAEHKAVIIAELEQQLASIYRYDQDEVWQEAAKAAQKVIGPAQEAVAARCKELGIPERFAPSINWTWSGRGENASRERRQELRAVGRTRAEAIEKQFIANGSRRMLELEADIVMSGLTSDSAKALLAEIMDVEKQMPRLDVKDLERLVDNRRRREQYRYGSYLADIRSDVDDC